MHGFPKVLGVLTHLDLFRKSKLLRKAKKTLKSRFWVEVYQGAKLFYLSGAELPVFLARTHSSESFDTCTVTTSCFPAHCLSCFLCWSAFVQKITTLTNMVCSVHRGGGRTLVVTPICVYVYVRGGVVRLTGLVHGSYPNMEVHNLSLYITRIKFRPLAWRIEHPYLLADRVEVRMLRMHRELFPYTPLLCFAVQCRACVSVFCWVGMYVCMYGWVWVCVWVWVWVYREGERIQVLHCERVLKQLCDCVHGCADVCDVQQDITDPAVIAGNELCNRSITMYGYVRGAYLKSPMTVMLQHASPPANAPNVVLNTPCACHISPSRLALIVVRASCCSYAFL